VEIDLPAGESVLLLKVTQGAGDWAACCRVRGADGFAAHGTQAMADPLRAAPLPGATSLLSGPDLSAWVHRNGASPGWTFAGGVATVVPGTGDLLTRQHFGDCTLHVEFLCPDTPVEVEGQARSNSGVYLQDRYEVQVLDSYGLEGADNECGGLYQVAKPLVNMCAPPTQWQTYDITFRAPVFDSQGNRKEPARMTVLHNGVRIHDNIALPGATTAALGGDPRQLAGVYLQDHGNKVQFRNIWAVELKD